MKVETQKRQPLQILKEMEGYWYIVSTNFPMWNDRKKSDITLNYTLVDSSKPYLIDEVKFLKNGKPKIIKGFDYQAPDDPYRFTWRGKGWMAFIKSEWRMEKFSPEEGWAILRFTKTLFTPAGVDIICRQPQMDPNTLENLQEMVKTDSVLAPMGKGLFTLPL